MKAVANKFSWLASLLLIALLINQSANAQTRFMQLRGQITSPAYEGWWPNDIFPRSSRVS